MIIFLKSFIVLFKEGSSSKAPEMPKEERIKKAQEVSTSRILTQDEFKKIQEVQARKEVERTASSSNKKRKHIDVDVSKDNQR